MNLSAIKKDIATESKNFKGYPKTIFLS